LNLQEELLGIVVAKSLFIDSLTEEILQVLEKPKVDLVYDTIELPGGITKEITSSIVFQTLVNLMANNMQTNIGKAVFVEHLVQLLKSVDK